MVQNNPSARAKGMMDIALKRMVREYPFHTNIITSSHVEEDPAVGTMGVTIRHNKIHLSYAPQFVCGCRFDELIGILHHEVNHILFDHIFTDPQKYSDPEARIMAEEVTVNEYVKEPLPGHPIMLDQFPELPPHEDTDTRYQRLAGKGKEMYQKYPTRDPKIRLGTPKNPSADRNSQADGVSVDTIDNHEMWAEARDTQIIGKMVVRVTVREATQGLSPDQWNKIPSPLQKRIDQICQGTGAGNTLEHISPPMGGKTCNWKQLLQQYVRQSLEIRPTFNRPPRRFPHLLGIVPGHSHRPGKTSVLAVIDTSASISSSTLEQICIELECINRTQRVTVVECDTSIQASYPYKNPIKSIRGRGGTDLRPPFHIEFLKKTHPDLVIYFTDGFGPAPERAPCVPTIWCLTEQGKKPALWGKEVRITKG
ncbi:MAG: VWA-like domain-containing protein [Pseudomonadota bacterium]